MVASGPKVRISFTEYNTEDIVGMFELRSLRTHCNREQKDVTDMCGLKEERLTGAQEEEMEKEEEAGCREGEEHRVTGNDELDPESRR
ncbi:hypothetical protein NDU88_002719 [Pleurodeles waltl]|uniref:Uncharacterized protein n=1 Tax=Pleurodeles waltl TaxID=8319 RepID=A0AAV7T345_PLEWA|nr:hypothetical protein NDU88_002719 [Pleurodeles waltl]